MAIMASAARDFPTTSGRDNLTAVAARGVPVTTRPHPLPTPPNSISPVLPPHGLKAQLQRAQLDAVESDLDLQEAQEEHDTRGHDTARGSPPGDATGNITSASLAKYHLPDILLNHGPLAIRHIMGYLTASVPGFSRIAPAQARRLVVGALEGRGIGGECGGLDGKIGFEKVGWGRWDASRRGQVPRSIGRDESPAPGAGIPIATSEWIADNRSRIPDAASADDEESVDIFSHDGHDMLENEVDNMSMDDLDGPASVSGSEASDDVALNDNPEDVTDDEDWATVGAAELRARSHKAQSLSSANDLNISGGGGMLSVSAGMRRAPRVNNNIWGNLDFSASAFGATPDAQEREAVEALLRLGSV